MVLSAPVGASEALAYADAVWEDLLGDLALLVAVPSVVDMDDVRPGLRGAVPVARPLTVPFSLRSAWGLRSVTGEVISDMPSLPERARRTWRE